jgi:acyl-coenzyme A thioesterase PaaI-like protein
VEIREEMMVFVEDVVPLSDRRRDLRRCADLLRQIGERVVRGDLGVDALAGLADDLSGAAARMGPVDGAAGPTAEHEIHPWIGLSNHVAPPMRFHVEDDTLVGELRCTATQGGAQERVHGGVIAGLFDAVMATRASMEGGVLTAKLTINFRAPVPVHTDLRLEATVDRQEGRKRFASARLLAGSTLCAEAEGLMIVLPVAD